MVIPKRAYLGLVCGALLAGQAPPDTLLLARIRVKMAENLAGLPNYTCTETIERSRREVPAKRYKLMDVVRLEVALVNGRELFAWPGERNFQDREVSDMVTGGAIGNGNFALHAKSIFQGEAASFAYRGREEVNGRAAVRYDYEVPRDRSGLWLRVGEARGIAGYRGSFWADAESLDLIRLEVRTTVIPPNVPLAGSRSAMEYERVAIGDHDYLLPGSSELALTDLNGNESRNRVQLTNCRQYTGESTLTFGEAPSAAAAPAEPAREFEVPEHIELEVLFEEGLRLEGAAVGDRVEGIVAREGRLRRMLVIPKRAQVVGRVTLVRRDAGAGYALLGVELTEVNFPGHRGKLRAHLLEAGSFAVLDNWRLLSTGPSQQLRGRLRAPADTRNVFAIPGNAGARSRLALRTLWRTEPLPKETP